MKKIVMSLLVIAVAIGLVGAGASGAFFSDTETRTGNTFTAGTIDIAVDGQNPWTGSFTVDDMKPSQVQWIEFTIQNVGQNPAVIWKHITVTDTATGTVTEPECTDQQGIWDPIAQACNWSAGGATDNNDIDTVMIYDLTAGANVIFAEEDGLYVSDVDCVWMPLGTIPAGGTLLVKQSYHLSGPLAGNWAQGDVMTLTIDLYAEQRMAPGPDQLSNKLFLDNKTGDTDWYFIADGTWGLLSKAGSYDFVAQGLQASTDYSLIVYPEPATWPNTVEVLKNGVSDANGNINWTGIIVGTRDHVKIWLVLSNDIVGDELTGWNPDDYLFEANLFTNP